jgi:hypothetical protein
VRGAALAFAAALACGAAGLPDGAVAAAQAGRARPAPCPAGEHCDCAAPGITIRWKAAYCLALNETDDLEQEAVSRCIAARDPAALARRGACQRNAHWKDRWCRTLHRADPAAARACSADRALIPPIVLTGSPP